MANRINAVDIPQVFDAATFDEIRAQLIDWLSNQDEFKDYNFAGSRLSVLIDLLAYNTLYIQQFSNSSLYESFIRTANLRSSVVQHAQDMGYLPSVKGASATTVRQTATWSPVENSPISITIPKGTKYTASIEDVDFYDYVTWEDVEVIRGIDNQYITPLNLIQGSIIRQERTYEKDGVFLINDSNIDRKYVRVFVNGAMWGDWTNKPIVQLGSASTIFYQRENVDGYTEIFFGEGEESIQGDGQLTSSYVGGLKPAVGAKVVIEYITTKGEAANGSRNFEYVDTIPNVVVSTVEDNPEQEADYTGSAGGGEAEDIERIRELAPVMRETQRRAVTSADYEAFVSYQFGNIIQAIQCYTDMEKPGYAFISIKPKDGLYLTTVQKEDIQNHLTQYNLAPITPVVHSPNYLYVTKDVKVTYSINDLSNTEEWLQGQVLNSIDRYYIEEVEIFNAGFYTSKMNAKVDATDVAVLGTTTDIGLVREVENFYTSPMAGVNFLNVVNQGSVYSSNINFESDVEDDYEVHYVATLADGAMDLEGNIDINTGHMLIGPFAENDISIPVYTGTDFDKQIIDGRDLYYNVGTVDYVTGKINFNLDVLAVDPDKFTATYIELHSQPTEDNIFTADGSLIVFENDLRPQYTNIKMEAIAQ